MLRPDKLRACMREVSSVIAAALEPFGFDPAPSIIVSDLLVRRWRRYSGWRTDALDVCHHRDLAANVHVDLRVFLPCPEGTETWLDGVAVAVLLGHEPSYRLAPRLGRARRGHCAGLGRAIAADAAQALPWFDRFASPAACLELLRLGETSWGRARSAVTAELATYLESLREEQPGNM